MAAKTPQGDNPASGANYTYDSYNTASTTLPGTSAGANQQSQMNPYAQDASTMGAVGGAYYQNQSSFTQPLNYHLYAPLGPHRENLLAFQRTAHDFFITDDLREELQRKAEASRQVLPNSSLPTQVDHFHSLVPLDTTNMKSAATFGYPTWIYKAVSAKDGKWYALRRLEGMLLALPLNA